MFWIAYSVTFVVALVIAGVLIAIRLVFSAVGKAFESILQLRLGNAPVGYRLRSRQGRSSAWLKPKRTRC